MLVSWCATAGVSPTPKSVRALARGVGLDSKQVWRIVAGLSDPRLPTARILCRELRVSLEAIATACEEARERELRRLDGERALAGLPPLTDIRNLSVRI